MLRIGTERLKSWRLGAVAAWSSALYPIVACSSGPTPGGTDSGSDSSATEASLPPDGAMADASGDDIGPSGDGSLANDSADASGSRGNDAANTDAPSVNDGAYDSADAVASSANAADADGSSPSDAADGEASTTTCPQGNGLYCGSSVGQDLNTLYGCTSGVLTVSQRCAGACKPGSPGVADACGPCPSGNGLYCGMTLSPNLDAKTLYQCSNGSVTVMQQCPTTCHVAAAGQNPYCS